MPVEQATIGAISRDALYDAVLGACGLSAPALIVQGRAAMAADDANIVVCEGVPETLRALAARGLELGVITNSASGADEKRAWLRAHGVDVRWRSFLTLYPDRSGRFSENACGSPLR
jgi:phosphoglycolate phosphatase-like HAD superfamily hydrolase